MYFMWLTYFYNFLYKNEPQCINCGNQNAKKGYILILLESFCCGLCCLHVSLFVCVERICVFCIWLCWEQLLQVSTLTLH